MSSEPKPNLEARLKLARQAHDSLEELVERSTSKGVNGGPSVKARVIVEHFATYEEEIGRITEQLRSVSGNRGDTVDRLEEEVKKLKNEITAIHRQRMREVGQTY